MTLEKNFLYFSKVRQKLQGKILCSVYISINKNNLSKRRKHPIVNEPLGVFNDSNNCFMKQQCTVAFLLLQFIQSESIPVSRYHDIPE